jgi:hypothetical protein
MRNHSSGGKGPNKNKQFQLKNKRIVKDMTEFIPLPKPPTQVPLNWLEQEAFEIVPSILPNNDSNTTSKVVRLLTKSLPKTTQPPRP